MSNKIKQAQLAQTARSSGERREMLINNRTTAFWFYPATNRKAKAQSLVMVHGYRGNHHGLEAIAGAIENCDVYIPDLPGFGESQPFATEHTIDNYAAWLNSFLTGLNLKQKPHLLGHSFGSIVVSAYAASFDGIATLILENPVSAPALQGPKAALTRLAKTFFWFAGALPERLGLAVLTSWPMVRGMSILMTKSRVADLRSWIHAQHDANFNDFADRRVALEGYAASISKCVGDFASEFKAPTLMLIGSKDDITSVDQQVGLYDALPVDSTRLVEFTDVGHLTHYEVPADVANAIEEWVGDQVA